MCQEIDFHSIYYIYLVEFVSHFMNQLEDVAEYKFDQCTNLYIYIYIYIHEN
jgi:hypothetical protein